MEELTIGLELERKKASNPSPFGRGFFKARDSGCIPLFASVLIVP